MKGALVFLVTFFIFLVITLLYPNLPPGGLVYYSVGGVNVNYPILGIPVPKLVPAVFNGVIYGIVVYVIYSVASWLIENKKQDKEKKQQKAE